MQETRRTSRLLATKQPWPQCILLQNLGQRDYQKKAQDVNDLRRHLFELDNNRELMAQVFFSLTEWLTYGTACLSGLLQLKTLLIILRED